MQHSSNSCTLCDIFSLSFLVQNRESNDAFISDLLLLLFSFPSFLLTVTKRDSNVDNSLIVQKEQNSTFYLLETFHYITSQQHIQVYSVNLETTCAFCSTLLYFSFHLPSPSLFQGQSYHFLLVHINHSTFCMSKPFKTILQHLILN